VAPTRFEDEDFYSANQEETHLPSKQTGNQTPLSQPKKGLFQTASPASDSFSHVQTSNNGVSQTVSSKSSSKTSINQTSSNVVGQQSKTQAEKRRALQAQLMEQVIIL